MSKYWKDGKWIETDAQSVNLIPHDEETGDIDFNVKQYFQASPEEPTNPDVEVWLDTDEEALPNELTKNVSIEEIQGRTLVNLLGRSGNAIYKNWNYGVWGDLSYEHDIFKVDKTGTTHDRCNLHTLDYDIGITSGKYYIAIAEIKGDDAYITGATANQIIKYTNYGSGYNIYCVAFTPVDNKYIEANSVSDIAYFKNLRLYEITSDEYYDINLLTAEEINMKYPYVDDVKCVVNPYLEHNENLVPIYEQYTRGNIPNNDGIVDIDPNHPNIVNISTVIKGEKGNTYTLCVEGLGEVCKMCKIAFWNMRYGRDDNFEKCISDNNKATIEALDNGVLKFAILTEGVESDAIEILELLNTGKIKPVIVRGDTPKSYNECSNSRIMFETKLYDDETITRRNDGTYVKNSEWEEVEINELLGRQIFVTADNSGYHTVCIDAKDIYDNALIAKLASYNGNIIINRKSFVTDYEHFYIDDSGHTNRHIVIILPNALTGWGDNYTPTQEEIKAFFLGWTMYGVGDTNPNHIYNDGGKGWAKLWCGIGEKASSHNAYVIDEGYTNTCPTVMNDQGYTPYRLIYKKENPTIEEVKTYGSLSIKNKNNITASSGLVLNEKFKMFFTPYHTRGGKDTNNSKYYRVQEFLKAKDRNNNIINFESVYGDNEYQIKFGKLSCNPIAVSDFQSYLYCDYLIYNPDTVKSFNYKINTSDDFTDYLNSLIKENNYLSQELSNTKQELNQIKYELSQRSNPNLFFNGDFQVWQRGESFSETGIKYTADRWRCGTDGEMDVKRQPYGVSITNTKVGTWHNFDQFIEVPNSLKGKTVTLSVKFHTPSNINQFYIGYRKNGEPDKSLYAEFNLKNITYYKKTFAVPETDCDILWAGFQLIEELGATIEFEWVKLELGEYATSFVPKSYSEELLACQRYYEKGKISSYFTNNNILINQYLINVSLNSVKRINTPTITITGFDSNGQLHYDSYNDGNLNIYRCSTEMSPLADSFIIKSAESRTVAENENWACIWVCNAEIY